MLRASSPALKIRRGKRTDLPSLQTLLPTGGPSNPTRTQTQHWRRLAADPSHDFYVADYNGTLQGALLVSYARALRQTGWNALLELLIRPQASPEIALRLLEIAKQRARQRGCLCIWAWPDHDRAATEASERAALFQQAGFVAIDELRSCTLS